jgi:outer membrane protein assembly factor BamB
MKPQLPRLTLFLIFAASLGMLCAADGTVDPIEGKWLGTAGEPENQSAFGLEIKRDAKGNLTGAVYLDALNYYNQPLPSLHADSGKYTVPEFGLELTLAGGRLTGTVAGAAPAELHRVAQLPVEPPVPSDLPAGPEPRWQTKLGSAIWATPAVRAATACVGTIGGVFHAVKISDGTLAWTFSAGRPVFGEALATDEAVYFTCDNGFLFKLERVTGRELWRYDLGDAQIPRILPHPAVYDYDHESPCPVLADGVLYVGAGDGGFHAINAADGKRVWRIAAPGKIRGTAAIVGANVVFGTLDGPVIMVERATGREVWRFDSKAPVTTSPALIGGRIVIGNRGSALYGIDPASGDRTWHKSWWGSWVESTAAPAGDLAVIGSSDYRRVTCFDPKDGRVAWRTDVYGWSWGRPVVTADTIYITTGGAAPYAIRHVAAITALDRTTGRIKWRRPVAAPANAYHWGFAGGAALDGGLLVVGGLDGTLCAFPVE